MLSYKVKVSQIEKGLIEAVRSTGYGEIFAVRLPEQPEPYCGVITATPAELDLLEYLRANGRVDILTIHNGQPSLLEHDLEVNGFRCRKKIKLPFPD